MFNFQVSSCAKILQRGTDSGLRPEEAWNRASVQLADAAEAHCRAFITDCYLETIRNGMSELSQPVKEVMTQLCELYCVYWALKKSGDFLQVKPFFFFFFI